MGSSDFLLKKIVLFCACLLFFSPTVSAKEVKVGMGNFAPYYIADGQTGIFTDLIIAVFEKLPNYEPVFIFGYPNNRLWEDFKRHKVDAVSNLFDTVEIEGCRSDPIFRFRDVAVTRASSNVTVKEIQDLEGMNIISFQGAKAFFGPEFFRIASHSNFSVASEPRVQAQALLDRRVDVSIGDLFIFLDNIKSHSGDDIGPESFRFHDILPVIYSRMGFWDKQLCTDFNLALKQVKESGEYEKIYDRYLRILGYPSVLDQ